MAKKRALGALEETIMEYLWTSSGPATPAEVHHSVAPELAYTTVMTVLTRLWDKGRLTRERQGRAYVYSPIRSEAEHRADTMQTSLDRAGDRAAVLSSFVETLSSEDAAELRKILRRKK